MPILVLANLVHHPHSQVSMKILTLSLFHKFCRKKGLWSHLMPSSGWIWFQCLVLKIVIVLKN